MGLQERIDAVIAEKERQKKLPVILLQNKPENPRNLLTLI